MDTGRPKGKAKSSAMTKLRGVMTTVLRSPRARDRIPNRSEGSPGLDAVDAMSEIYDLGGAEPPVPPTRARLLRERERVPPKSN